MLQTIAVMAEEGSLEAIQGLIINLSKVLRYISSTEETTTTLRSEVECAQSYLAAMHSRFGNSLEYRVDVPEALRDIVVPRLILQPFLENCFKYATANRPPWEIVLRGRIAGGSWEIEITDNGPGFSEATLRELANKTSLGAEKGGGLTPMSISGMGMLNTAQRLRLSLGETAYFRVSNSEAGGARVVLGACLHG